MRQGFLSPQESVKYADSLNGKYILGGANAVVGAGWGSTDAGGSDVEIGEMGKR